MTGQTTYSKGSTMLEFRPSDAKQFISAAEEIPDADLYTGDGEERFGREDQPHITVLYGLDDANPASIADLSSHRRPIRVRLGDILRFERDNYDVIVVEVRSSPLHNLHNTLRDELPNEYAFTEYKPHVTLAYVQKGKGDELVGDNRFDDKQFTFDRLTVSNKSGVKSYIPFTGLRAIPLAQFKKAASNYKQFLKTSSPRLLKVLPQVGRRITGVKPGETWKGNFKQRPIRTMYNTALAPLPAIPHGNKIVLGGTAAGLASDAYSSYDDLVKLEQEIKTNLEQVPGFKEEQYQILRNQGLTGLARGAWDRLSGGIDWRDYSNSLPNTRKLFTQVADAITLPVIREKIDNYKQDWSANPYTSSSLKRYYTHPSLLAARNFATRAGVEGGDKVLDYLNIPETNPIRSYFQSSKVPD